MTPPTLDELLTQLETAVRNRDGLRAVELTRQIEQRIVASQHEHAAVERRMRELLAELDEPAGQLRAMRLPVEDSGTLERGGLLAAEARESGELFPVWYGTNRRPNARGDGFTSERDRSVTRGRVNVFVPEGHRFGETGTSLWTKLKRFDLRDDRLRVQQVERQERDAFFAEIHEVLNAVRESGQTSHALFFLHGFNVTFDEAAIRAAQIGFDLNVPGATAFFSWPSRGSVTAYPADEATIEASERAITDFLVDFTKNCGADKVHVIAHSMGNRGLLRSLQRIAANAQTRGQVKFGQVFLAAPDVDQDLFLDLARLYPEHSERTTLYASDGDLPVHLSAKLHDAPRAGYFAPYTVAPGIDTVAVPDFDLDLLGHSYFAQADALLNDMAGLIRRDEAPASRQRIKPDMHNGTSFWKLRR